MPVLPFRLDCLEAMVIFGNDLQGGDVPGGAKSDCKEEEEDPARGGDDSGDGDDRGDCSSLFVREDGSGENIVANWLLSAGLEAGGGENMLVSWLVDFATLEGDGGVAKFADVSCMFVELVGGGGANIAANWFVTLVLDEGGGSGLVLAGRMKKESRAAEELVLLPSLLVNFIGFGLIWNTNKSCMGRTSLICELPLRLSCSKRTHLEAIEQIDAFVKRGQSSITKRFKLLPLERFFCNWSFCCCCNC